MVTPSWLGNINLLGKVGLDELESDSDCPRSRDTLNASHPILLKRSGVICEYQSLGTFDKSP